MKGRFVAHREGPPDTSHSVPRGVLQQEIRAVEKELQRLYEQRDAQLLRTRLISAESVAEKADSAGGRVVPFCFGGRTHVLRIEDSPPPSPQSFIRTPESVALRLTGERRRLVHGKPPVAAAGSLMVVDNPSEFATRLRRLYHAAHTGATPAELAARVSLLCSPIPMVPSHDDVSCTDLFHEVGSSFSRGSEARTVRDSRDSGAGCPRHVRFSSKSPRVSVFSVDRPCDGAASPPARSGKDEDESTFVQSAASSVVGGANVRVGHVASLVEDVPGSGGTHDASLVFSPPPVDSDATLQIASRISTRLSPRSSVTSYLAVLHELRSSLLHTSPRHVPRRSVGAPGTAARDDKVDAATPTKQPAVSAGMEEGSKTPILHCESPCNAATRTACTLPCDPPQSREALTPQRSSTILCVEDALDSVLRSSPVFLRRPERQRLSPPTAAQSLPLDPKSATRCEAARVEGVVGRRRGGKAQCSPSAPQPRARQRMSPPTTITRAKKTVHFPSSLGHPEHDPPQQPAGRRRRGKRKRVECVPPTVTTSAKTPADMRVEAPGFGAGILLASGPTLYFE